MDHQLALVASLVEVPPVIRHVVTAAQAEALMPTTCQTCGGRGKRPRIKDEGPGHVAVYVELTDPCSDCEGLGTLPPASQLLIVDAVEHICSDWNPTPIRKMGPPAEYLNATKPCERCAGLGSVLVIDPPPRGAHEEHCKTCDGEGRERVGIYVECPHDCKRFGGKVPGHTRGSSWDWVPCWCDGTGLVLVGTAVATAVMPIVMVDSGRFARPCILWIDGHFEYWPESGEPEPVDLTLHDPASLPGRFGVLVTDARRAE